MRTPAIVLVLLTSAGYLASPIQAQSQTPARIVSPNGTEMSTYYIVLLRRGPKWTSAVTPETSAVSKAHMDNIERLTQSGQMLVAGPFLDQTGDRALAGMFILRAASADAAKSLADSDPAVKAGRFVYEILPWLGPASLRQ
ncbi:MAG TPA: YciI family protein [Vicinamibacterales bacterium]|nr:YciI family protein [Vicinamibacterales bacterium]